MKHVLVMFVLLGACAGTEDGGGGGSGSGSGSGSGTTQCSNYTPPDLPDSMLVWHDQVALAEIEAMTKFSVTGSASHNSAGKITRYTKYNQHGQVLESIDPNAVLTVNTYDLRQRLLSTSVGGQKTSYTYDGFDRLSKTSYPSTTKGAGTSSGTDFEELVYDAGSNVTSRRPGCKRIA